jgi:NDP-sugar pyrophosphorylase family protein
MPDLIGHLIKDGGEVSVFPIREFWLDIGHHDDYKAANSHYERLFK